MWKFIYFLCVYLFPGGHRERKREEERESRLPFYQQLFWDSARAFCAVLGTVKRSLHTTDL